MMILVTGGSASGKSKYAEDVVLGLGAKQRLYIATMQPWDEECRQRIDDHRKMRAGKGFLTIEQYYDLQTVKWFAGNDSVILLECMSNLAANEYYRSNCQLEPVVELLTEGILHLCNQAEHIVVVTNEVFSDGEVYPAETQRYLQVLGSVNQRLAQMADQVVEVVCGIALQLK